MVMLICQSPVWRTPLFEDVYRLTVGLTFSACCHLRVLSAFLLRMERKEKLLSSRDDRFINSNPPTAFTLVFF